MTGDCRPRATVQRPSDTASSPRTDVFARIVDGRYRILERLAEGPAGVVYRAQDVLLERVTVLKSIGASRDEHAPSIERVTREARALARVRHGNVAQIYAYGVHDGAPFIAMEYVEGASLGAIIDEHAARGTTVSLGCVLTIVRGVAAGLGAVHARGIVHRAVTPSNILIEVDSGRPVLIDFGLADLERTSNPKITARGTSSYLAPEQVSASEQRSTKRADIYAFACTIFELLTGKAVFEGAAHEVMRAHLSAPPPLVSSIDLRLRPFDAVLVRAMSKAPAARHASCEELLADLETAANVVRGAQPIRAIVHAEAEPLRRRLVRFVEEALGSLERPVVAECYETYEEASAAFTRAPAEIVVLDTRATGAEAHEAASAIRAASAGAHLVVLAADWHTTDPRLTDLGARRLPKPINAHLARSVFRAAAEKIAFQKGE